jgi:hypothetical protein
MFPEPQYEACRIIERLAPNANTNGTAAFDTCYSLFDIGAFSLIAHVDAGWTCDSRLGTGVSIWPISRYVSKPRAGCPMG